MTYKYFRLVENNKHYLYASEAAELLYNMFGLTSATGKRALALVAAWLDHLEKEDRPYLGPLYYQNRHGEMRRVYTKIDKLIDLCCQLTYKPPMEIWTTDIDGRKYKFKIKSCAVN